MNYLNHFKDWIYLDILKINNDDNQDEEIEENDDDGNFIFNFILCPLSSSPTFALDSLYWL